MEISEASRVSAGSYKGNSNKPILSDKGKLVLSQK